MGSITILGVEYDIATTTKLELGDTNITNDDVLQIGKLVNLIRLVLSGNQISVIIPLANLTKLTYLRFAT